MLVGPFYVHFYSFFALLCIFPYLWQKKTEKQAQKNQKLIYYITFVLHSIILFSLILLFNKVTWKYYTDFLVIQLCVEVRGIQQPLQIL